MTAREPSAVEVIAEALLAEGLGPGDSLHSWRCDHPTIYGPCGCVREVTEAALAAIRAMTPEQQAEVIGGEVRRFTTLKPHSDTEPSAVETGHQSA